MGKGCSFYGPGPAAQPGCLKCNRKPISLEFWFLPERSGAASSASVASSSRQQGNPLRTRSGTEHSPESAASTKQILSKYWIS